MTGAGPRYSDAEATALYDVLNPWQASDDHYASLATAATSVLDIGCGTGTVLKAVRAAGHPGRLVGVDPDPAALEVARQRTDVEWLVGTAAAMPFEQEFDLVTMTGHAFQCLVTDDEVRSSLAAVRRALVPGGRFAFETRNPAVRAWEQWHAAPPRDVVDPAGRRLQVSHQVLTVDGDRVTFTETTSDPDGTELRVDRTTLRFLPAGTLQTLLARAGFTVAGQFGGLRGEPLGAASPEIVTVARAGPTTVPTATGAEPSDG